MNPFHLIVTVLRRVIVRVRPVPAPETAPTVAPEAPAVPAPRRLGPRTMAVIRSATLRTRDGERIVTVLATCRAGRREFTVRCSSDLSQESRCALGLDAFERLLADAERHAERVVLHVHDARLRTALAESAAAFPRIDLANTQGLDPLGRLDVAARERLRAESVVAPAPSAAPARQVRVGPPLRVGADASKSRRPGVGVGVATERGELRATFFARTADIVHGELRAIEFALESYPDRPLLIESDSLTAVRYLASDSQPSNRVHAAAVGRIRKRVEATSSRVVWVRGHHGHDLNEAADRASRAARRQHEFGLESDWLNEMLDNIAADCFSAIAV